MWVPISSTNTSPEGSTRPNSLRHRSLKNSSRSRAPVVLFSAVRETPKRSADGSLAHRDPAGSVKELGPLGVGGPRALSEVF